MCLVHTYIHTYNFICFSRLQKKAAYADVDLLKTSLFILWGGAFSTINKCFCSSSSSSLWLLCFSERIMCPYDNCALLRYYLSWLTRSTPQIDDGKGTMC